MRVRQGPSVTIKLGKIFHLKNDLYVNGSLNNSVSEFGAGGLGDPHASISTDNNMTNANLINISI